MSQPARAATRTIAAVAFAALLAPAADCYKPSIEPGGLQCATSGKLCPDGFTCLGTVCVSATTDASSSTGGHAGTLGSGGRGGSGGQGAIGGSGGLVGSGGTTPGTGGAGPDVGQACTIMNRGAPTQSDDCQSDAVCAGNCAQTTCFRTCTSDDGCPGSTCSRLTTAGTKICELTYTLCDPHDGQQGCDPSTYCYLLSDQAAPLGGDRTVCDCTWGEQAVGQPCMDSRDCFPRQVCPASGLPGGQGCRAVCDPSNLSVVECPVLTTCHAFGSRWGYCY